VGVLIGPLFLICSLEFVGRVDDSGWKVAEVLTPVTYVVWSLWLIAVGVGHSSEEVATTAAGHAPAGARY